MPEERAPLEKHRVVVDTNIFVSSFWGGNPRKLIRLFLEGKITLLSSPEIIEEVERVLKRILGNDSDANNLISLFKLKATIVKPRKTYNVIKDDPHDNKFLACAYEGEADFIISGDKHLLQLTEFKCIKVITVKQFLDLL